METNNKIHAFEKAGLGKAPFSFVGYEYRTFQACHGAPVQVGGSCDFCGAGLCNMFEIESADGKRFHVGPDCVRKTGDAGLGRAVDAVEKKARENKAANDAAKSAGTLAGMLCNDEIFAALYAAPHPRGFSGLSFLDYAHWMFSHAGNAGRKKTIKEIRALIG